jgi:probable rRNA maturation factor
MHRGEKTVSIYIEEEGNVTLPFDTTALATKVIDASLDYMNCPYEVEVNVLLTMNEQIAQMNQEFRQMDKPTDVLSFPMLSYEVAGEFDLFEEQADCFHPETGELMLGDIVISKEKVVEQAQLYGHSKEREYAFLIAHSMLHLFGFDHMEEEERVQMEQMQREILEEIQILRD